MYDAGAPDVWVTQTEMIWKWQKRVDLQEQERKGREKDCIWRKVTSKNRRMDAKLRRQQAGRSRHRKTTAAAERKKRQKLVSLMSTSAGTAVDQSQHDSQTCAALAANSDAVPRTRAPKGSRCVMGRVTHCFFATKLIAEVVENATDPIIHLVGLDGWPKFSRFCLFFSRRSSVSVRL